VQLNDPYLSENEFLGHASHDDSPVSLLYVPGLHLVHACLLEFPPSIIPYVPVGHGLHFSFSVSSFYVPILHFLHKADPALFCYVPTGQSIGSLHPLFGHLLPLGHSKQSST